jgi:hypothetical protein
MHPTCNRLRELVVRHELEDLRAGLFEDGDIDGQVELLRMRAAWPLRCPDA